MRCLLLISILVFGLRSWAFQYEIESGSLLQPSQIKAQELSDLFAREGLWSIRGQSLIHAHMPFDFVYVNQNWDKALLLKEGLRAPSDQMGKILRNEKLAGSVFHFEFAGSSYVLVALGFSAEELQTVLAGLKPRSSFSKWSLLINSAQAETCRPVTSATDALARSSGGLEEGMLLRTIGKCGADAWQGVLHSGEKTLDFFKKLATDPGALWGQMKNSFLELKEFVLNMKTDVQNMVNQFNGLTSEQKMQLACTIAGEVLGGAAQAALAFGAAAKLFPMLLAKLRQSAALFGKLAELKKQGVSLPDLNLATREILSCAY